jgi:hypothetical protein
MNTDAHLMMEAYKSIREATGLQNFANAAPAAAAGAVAGAKQIGKNMMGAVAGSAQAPQSPMTAAKQAFNQQQVDQALDSVLKAYNLPASMKQHINNTLQQMAITSAGSFFKKTGTMTAAQQAAFQPPQYK